MIDDKRQKEERDGHRLIFNERGKNQNGKPFGFYELWLEGGQKREEGQWSLDGEYLIKNRWNKQGTILINDGNGSLLGKNKDGLVVWKKEYINGRLEFDQQNKHEFYSNGQVKSEIGYFEGKKRVSFCRCICSRSCNRTS